VGLHPRCQGPENFRRIVDVDIVVEDEDVFALIGGQGRCCCSARVTLGALFHRDKDIHQGMAAVLAHGG